MAIEIEHKYLVKNAEYLKMEESHHEIKQGYLQTDPNRTVRVRTYDKDGYITVKGITHKDARKEFEYKIAYEDAIEMLDMCECAPLEKTRHIVWFSGHRWEIDEFHGALQGLVLAEIELSGSDENYEIPPFVGKNVTGEPQYYNSTLNAVCGVRRESH